MVGCHQPRRQSGQSGHHKPDGIGRKHGIQCRLCHLQTGSSCGGSFMGRSHRGGGSGMQRRDSCSCCHGRLIAQDCRRDGHNCRRQDADGLLERGHFGVVLGDGDDQLVCLDDDVPESREQPAGQFTGQRGHVVLQGAQPAVEGLAGLQHTVVELPALTGGSSHGGFQLIEADLAVRDALVEGAHALAGGVADLIERVEARVDHHVDVFQRDLLGAGHLAIGPHEGLELVRVAQRNIAQTFQYAGGVVRRDAELQEGLGPLGQVGQGEGRGRRHLPDLFQLLGGKLFVAQHDLEVGQIAFHLGVVVQTGFDHAFQAGCSFLGKVRDELACGHGPLARGFLSRVTVELYFAGNAKICGHGVHLFL